MAEKPQQESFLAQLSEVEVAPVLSQIVDVVQVVDPLFGVGTKPGTADSLNFGDAPNSNHLKIEQPDAYHRQPVGVATTHHSVVPATVAALSHSANGESTSSIHNSPKTPNQTPPQTVTGNVKIQLMEISVDEFKVNVEYIQQQFPSLARRLVCDAFSKANFDCRLAIELLTKEQEKKDQTILPPAMAAATAASKQHHQTPTAASSTAAPAAAAAAATPTPPQSSSSATSTPATPATPKSAAVAAAADPAAAATPTAVAASSPSPAAAFRGGRGGHSRRRSHQSSSSSTVKEDPCYRRVTSVDKEAERVLRQKLKSNVRSRVFNHGVKIGHGRETAANLFEQQRMKRPSGGDTAVADSSSSAVDGTGGDNNVDASMTTVAKREVAAESAAADSHPPDGAGSLQAQEEEVEAYTEPQSAMRILRDSFPGLDEARIAESLDACDQDVDAAIRLLSGRSPVRASPSGARFFKSKQQQQSKVQRARQHYVRAELSTGAWMDRPPSGVAAGSAAASAVAKAGAPAGAPASTTTLRVYTVQPKRRISDE